MEDLSKIPGAVKGILIRKDKRIRELQEKLKSLRKKNSVIIDHFRESTDALLEKIKQLETAPNGTRPQTANILSRIGILI